MSRHRKLIALGCVVIALIVLLVSGVLPDLPDPKKLIEDLAQALGPWTYLLVAVAAFLETGAFVGLVAPGETTVIVGGVIAGQGEVDLMPLIGLIWVSCVLGDTASFLLGRRLGRDFLLRHGPKLRIDSERLERVESYFERHGGKTILIGRFIGLVRALAPFVAGTSGLPYRRFIPFSIIGCGAWATLFSVLGYLFYRSFDRVAALAGQVTLALGITVAILVGGVYAYRRLGQEEERRRLAAWVRRASTRPPLRPLVAALGPLRRRVARPAMAAIAPRARFLGDRLTPGGGLGLELTTALAVAGVGLYVFTLYALILSPGRRTAPADLELLELGDALRPGAAVDVARVMTDLGAPATVSALGVSVAVLLLLRRRFAELGALLAGSLALVVCLQLAKNAIDRPRPGSPLVVSTGSSFPSGHAAYSTLWIGAAILVARVVPGFAKDAGLVALALVIALVVGLSRVYLRVHYWSDVAGGWALGAAVLGATAAATLVVVHIRHNGGEPEESQ